MSCLIHVFGKFFLISQITKKICLLKNLQNRSCAVLSSRHRYLTDQHVQQELTFVLVNYQTLTYSNPSSKFVADQRLVFQSFQSCDNEIPDANNAHPLMLVFRIVCVLYRSKIQTREEEFR